jgi:hypothetical protein
MPKQGILRRSRGGLLVLASRPKQNESGQVWAILPDTKHLNALDQEQPNERYVDL